ncbi:MAG TPA: hypothetical protein VFY06_09530 [Verrucomicrobiae bacterium]|nr:hypothetical protein [Verrucomicrobiae bacterium]
MKNYFIIVALTALSFGCVTHRQSVSLNLNPNEETIRRRMQDELIPFPTITPFDSDAKKRQAYLTGFSRAWNFVASGSALHATAGFVIPSGFEEPWNSGWKDGYKIASDRWMAELNALSK